jgi:hypothetical protein
MKNRKMLGSTLVFFGTLLCFFLPFVTVSCNGKDVFAVTGQQLVTGTSGHHASAEGPEKPKISPNPFAAAAVLSAVLGLILSSVGRRMIRSVAMSGAVGTASLAAMKVQLDYQIHKQAMGMAQNNYQVGYFLALLLMFIGAGWNFYKLGQQECNPESSTPPLGVLRS